LPEENIFPIFFWGGGVPPPPVSYAYGHWPHDNGLCCSSNWREAVKTLSKLADNNGITIHSILYFDEPYIGPEEIPDIVEDTYQQTRSQ